MIRQIHFTCSSFGCQIFYSVFVVAIFAIESIFIFVFFLLGIPYLREDKKISVFSTETIRTHGFQYLSRNRFSFYNSQLKHRRQRMHLLARIEYNWKIDEWSLAPVAWGMRDGERRKLFLKMSTGKIEYFLFLPLCRLFRFPSLLLSSSPFLALFAVCFVAGRTSNRSLCDLRHLRLFNCLLNWLIWKTDKRNGIDERMNRKRTTTKKEKLKER